MATRRGWCVTRLLPRCHYRSACRTHGKKIAPASDAAPCQLSYDGEVEGCSEDVIAPEGTPAVDDWVNGPSQVIVDLDDAPQASTRRVQHRSTRREKPIKLSGRPSQRGPHAKLNCWTRPARMYGGAKACAAMRMCYGPSACSSGDSNGRTADGSHQRGQQEAALTRSP